ncbi:plexin domain-containing protein 2 [Danaus plexippus]|uniref:plexin domain-containing protein 2 n=1 Tax=Danaus plexippus TaxID=13037 RepID=UPI002AAF68A9|nr:plexin domain-containing protein 2 [Danaus plexippus]
MDFMQLKIKMIFLKTIFVICLSLHYVVTAEPEYTVHRGSIKYDGVKPEILPFQQHRLRRDASTYAVSSEAALVTSTLSTVTSESNYVPNVTAATTNATEATSAPSVVVTKIPLLGVNGSGVLHVNVTGNTPKVSDPILPDDNFPNIFKETPETIKAEQNLTSLNYDNHAFYNSSFIGNVTYFQEYWANITEPKSEVHSVLSDSHRRATTIKLSFDFPFYGHVVRNITVATGGFLYTGDHVHNWLAATQYIAPLMANFDTTITNDSLVKMHDDGEKFSVFWEKATLQEDHTKKFTFAVTLYNNGDIIFAYKDIPIPVQKINDVEHPVKVGISDAYLNDKILFYVRRKTIYEYHRISFMTHEITNNTILKLIALPTCLEYNTCSDCLNHNTGFNCLWCEKLQKCSSGTDRNKQDWLLRNCEKFNISSVQSCPASPHVDQPAGSNTAYETDSKDNNTDTAVLTDDNTEARVTARRAQEVHTTEARSPVGGVVAAFLAVALVCSLVSWALYAFKNPHTRSGQLLIKYRPSQWNWRRGEARYTAATIHM